MVEIRGLEKFAPKDFPGQIASTVFLGGCNFRCPFCHNLDLVLNPDSLPIFPLQYFKDYLESRDGWLDGICVSGGEPFIHKDLEMLLTILKGRDLLVKIDTNGSFPNRLQELIEKKLIDQVAMDIKAPLDKYEEAAGVKVEISKIRKSIKLLIQSGIDYVFRTTAVPGLITVEDIEKIGKMLKGSKRFQIQQFFPDRTLDEEYARKKPYTKQELEEFADIARPYFSEVKIEGK